MSDSDILERARMALGQIRDPEALPAVQAQPGITGEQRPVVQRRDIAPPRLGQGM